MQWLMQYCSHPCGQGRCFRQCCIHLCDWGWGLCNAADTHTDGADAYAKQPPPIPAGQELMKCCN